jgi:hypothetical protein
MSFWSFQPARKILSGFTLNIQFCYVLRLNFDGEHHMFRLLALSLCLLTAACTNRFADFFPYYNNGIKKPSFTMLPVFNETDSIYVENFPKELSKAIRNRLKRTGKTYSPPVSVMQQELGSASLKGLFDASDLKAFDRFKGTDFVVLIETAETNVVPYKRGTVHPLYIADIPLDDAKVLMIDMRLKIVNMKGKEPKIARMERVLSNHMVTPSALERAAKGDASALEVVRSRIATDLSKKIEETLCVKQ